jgi:hypothetical protein
MICGHLVDRFCRSLDRIEAAAEEIAIGAG